jgi:hypothetical protein
MTKAKLSPVALGLSLGLVWGVSIFVMGLLAHFFAYGTAFVTSMGVMYVGYEPSIIGSLIGGTMGFIDGFIGGAVIAWLYNVFLCCFKKDKCD